MFHGGRDAGKVADRAETHIKVELLSERDVEAPNPLSDRRRQRALDRDTVFADRFNGLRWEEVGGTLGPEKLLGLLAGEDLFPSDLPLSPVGLLDRSLQDLFRRAPDVGSCAISLDERDDRFVWNFEETGGIYENWLSSTLHVLWSIGTYLRSLGPL